MRPRRSHLPSHLPEKFLLKVGKLFFPLDRVRTDHFTAMFQELSLLDRMLTPLILIFMIVGVIIGHYAPEVKDALDTVKFYGVSARKSFSNRAVERDLTVILAIAIGLIVMMWPVLTKVEYERIPALFQSKQLWVHIGISMVLNWIIGPFLMLGLAWATLPDLPGYRVGVIMVGIARCIAMVMIWNDLARGDPNYCAILVVINAIMQMVLFSPYAVLFINKIGNQEHADLTVGYGKVAISVLIVSSCSTRSTSRQGGTLTPCS